MKHNSFYGKYIKRLLDLIFSGIGLIVLAPVFLIITVLVRLRLGAPVIFKQERPGKNEKIFLMYKYRTMNDTRDSSGKLLPDDERLTKFGKLLRSTSLDELPELWNIFKGDMSIVGPRPLLVEYLPLYNKEQRRRHLVRPGLTGLAQVNGRNTVSWADKFKFDNRYIETLSLFNDIKIIGKTMIKVFIREGISADDNITVQKFEGNK
ncbi:sugar transferase [Enterococcus xiangfangensis]|uniref:sugar transferase n=1 Tax=Enterococcus xiangfangensis TaxID=1296537 RepID=UPI0010FA2098|nr:sugar transferase [Enterococcus xiangfangensis]MBM7712985.1 lipopolysaccharide/colanic/teichoic acid biosynthesis glycosyltransferase [Enterococcus xiangfangensis]